MFRSHSFRGLAGGLRRAVPRAAGVALASDGRRAAIRESNPAWRCRPPRRKFPAQRPETRRSSGPPPHAPVPLPLDASVLVEGACGTRHLGNAPRLLALASDRPRRLTPGTILADRYRIVALVGRGGMGEVYRADDLRLGQPVALKFLPPELEDNPFARERLLAEVRSARTVSHPNVCRVYDIGEAHGRLFLTMEFIDGEDLASLLRRIGRLPADKALEIARQLCAGLAAAHDTRRAAPRPQAGQRDDRRAAARRASPTSASRWKSRTGSRSRHGVPDCGRGRHGGLHGTRAIRRGAGTVQSDLYALGLVLYEIYTGKPALNATTVEGWRRAHGDSTPSDPSALVAEIEPAVERAILRCLEKDPAKRPASAAQLAASLPGGDPLAAALAAGETPSPELVAASGGRNAAAKAGVDVVHLVPCRPRARPGGNARWPFPAGQPRVTERARRAACHGAADSSTASAIRSPPRIRRPGMSTPRTLSTLLGKTRSPLQSGSESACRRANPGALRLQGP